MSYAFRGFTNLVLGGHNVKPNQRLETVYINYNKKDCPVDSIGHFIRMSISVSDNHLYLRCFGVFLFFFFKSVLSNNETHFLWFTFRRQFPEHPRTIELDFCTQLYLQMFTLVGLVLLCISLFTKVLLQRLIHIHKGSREEFTLDKNGLSVQSLV